MKKAVFCLASSESQADRIVENLLNAGYENEDISILSPEQKSRARTNVQGEVGRGPVTNGEVRRRTAVEGEEYKEISSFKKGNLGTEKHTKSPEGATTGAVAGGILGGSLGLLAGIGSLAIPGVGPFIAAGPLMAALSGSGIGGGLGLLIGAFVGAGIPEFEAKKFEAGLKAGNILIAVHVNTDQELNKVSEIMKKNGGKDVCSSKEKSKSSR